MESQIKIKSPVSIQKKLFWAGSIFAGIVICILFLNLLFFSAKEKEGDKSVTKPEMIELRDLRAREVETLNSYKMLDEQNGIVQIPIERAMQLLANEAFTEQTQKAR